MIIGIIHKGSGLGDQLFSYIAARVRAADLGVDYGFVGKEFFKGASFMNLDWGINNDLLDYYVHEETGAVKFDPPIALSLSKHTYILNKPYYDPEFNFIPDGSVIDGYGAQDIRYFEHRLDEVREWIQIKDLSGFYDKVCVINFRGGEYKLFPELYLTQEYWDKAVQIIRDKGIDDDHFLVVTDDIDEAIKFFPKFRISHNLEDDWKSVLMSDYLILSNSAFGILPALLNSNVVDIIAPRYWAGRNVGEWRRPGNYYKKFTYI